MSVRIKREFPSNKPENSKNKTLRPSIKRYNSRVQENQLTLHSQDSSSQNSPVNQRSPQSHIKKTPHRTSTHYSKHSEPTLADYTNSSLSDLSSQDFQNLFENPAKTRIRRVNKSAYSAELESCQKEIGRLQVKLKKIKENESKKPVTEDFCLFSSKEVAKKLKSQKEFLEKQFEFKLKQQRSELIQEYEREIERRNSEDFEEVYQNEIFSAEKEFEKKLDSKVAQMKTEFDRILKRTREENLDLKRQNEKLRRQIEERDEIRVRGFTGGHREENIDYEAELRDLGRRYDELQRSYVYLKKKTSNALCVKCMAFTKVECDLSVKIEKIKLFLENS